MDCLSSCASVLFKILKDAFEFLAAKVTGAVFFLIFFKNHGLLTFLECPVCFEISII